MNLALWPCSGFIPWLLTFFCLFTKLLIHSVYRLCSCRKALRKQKWGDTVLCLRGGTMANILTQWDQGSCKGIVGGDKEGSRTSGWFWKPYKKPAAQMCECSVGQFSKDGLVCRFQCLLSLALKSTRLKIIAVPILIFLIYHQTRVYLVRRQMLYSRLLNCSLTGEVSCSPLEYGKYTLLYDPQ